MALLDPLQSGLLQIAHPSSRLSYGFLARVIGSKGQPVIGAGNTLCFMYFACKWGAMPRSFVRM